MTLFPQFFLFFIASSNRFLSKRSLEDQKFSKFFVKPSTTSHYFILLNEKKKTILLSIEQRSQNPQNIKFRKDLSSEWTTKTKFVSYHVVVENFRKINRQSKRYEAYTFSKRRRFSQFSQLPAYLHPNTHSQPPNPSPCSSGINFPRSGLFLARCRKISISKPGTGLCSAKVSFLFLFFLFLF